MIARRCFISYSFDPVAMPFIEYNILNNISFILSLDLSRLAIPIQASSESLLGQYLSNMEW